MQLVLEVPIEKADETLSTLGGFPQPKGERWVAVAVLDLSHKPQEPGPDTRGLMNVGLEHHEEAQKPKRKMAELPLITQSVLLSEREAFWTFLKTTKSNCWLFNQNDKDGIGRTNIETAKMCLYDLCKMNSRSKLGVDPIASTKFIEIRNEFQDWISEPL
jgi:hypothetical protein